MKPVPTNDIYKEAYAKYVNTSFTNSLEKEFRILPYHIKYKLMYWVALAFTYIFNVLSFATGSALVYFFFLSMMHQYLAIAITLSLAVLLEISKRSTANTWAKNLFLTKKIGWDLLVVILVLSAISVIGSYHGAKKSIHEITPDFVAVQSDTLKDVTALNTKITELKTDKAKLEKQTDSKGTIYYQLQPSVNALTVQIAALENEVLAIQSDTRQSNTSGANTHEANTKITAGNVALIAVVSELFYLLLVVWCKYYRFKSYKVLTAIQNAALADPNNNENNNTNTNDPNTANNGRNVTPATTNNAQNNNANAPHHNNGNRATPPATTPSNKAPNANNNTAKIKALKAARTKIRNKLNTNKSRLIAGEGTPSTLRNNIAKYTAEIEAINNELRPMLGNR